MTLSRHTDNRSLAAKVLLRKMVIKKMRLEPVRVLDLYAGEGAIWQQMQREKIQVESYTPIDRARRQAGQIHFKTSPRLIAALNGDDDVSVYAGEGLTRFNVIDLDAFGDAWAVYRAIVLRLKARTAIFVTRGSVAYGAGRANLSKAAREAMGIPTEWDIPIKLELIEMADRHAMLQSCETATVAQGYQIKMPRKGSAVTYFGLILEPKREKQDEQKEEESRDVG